jgi:hypothetical protein
MTTTITMIPTNGGRFTTAIDGHPLVTAPTTNPEYGSCRALVARGQADGPVQFRHVGSQIVSSRIRSIHVGATRQTIEGDGSGLRRVAYRPFGGISAATLPTCVQSAEFGHPVQVARHV